MCVEILRRLLMRDKLLEVFYGSIKYVLKIKSFPSCLKVANWNIKWNNGGLN